MANRPRTIDEKVKPVQIALEQINIETLMPSKM
jgi:DNA-directed RNA polymerase subunit K/omega